MVKKDWELGHLQALKKEEEKRVAAEEDEILYTYSREEALQVKKNKSKCRPKSNSHFSSRKSSYTKETKKVLDSQVECKGAVRNNRNRKSTSSRASSRSSSCSSSKRITTRRTKFSDEI